MKIISYTIFITMLAFFVMINADAVVFTNLYTFSAGSVNNPVAAGNYGGNNPQAVLLLSGNTFYGTTLSGSTNSDGTIFKYSPNSGFTSIHTFSGPDGANPQADLVLSGSTLFGTTANGGIFGGGTVFSINTNGTGFTNLFSFAYTNGGNSQAGLALSGNTLYGTTAKGGAYGAGTVFAIGTNGTGFTNIYNFNYTNGANPEADLLLLGNTLYGTTVNGGGSNGLGTIFAVNTNGVGFTNLLIFTGTNGANPQAGLTLVSNVLCGTTANGGNYNAGTAFLIGINGTRFDILYSFGVTFTDGRNPYSRLVVSSNGASSYSMYGTTEFGGNSSSINGTVFTISLSGPDLMSSAYSILYKFSSEPFLAPVAGLILSGNTLYGTASGFGTGGGIFSMSTSGGLQSIHTFEYPGSAYNEITNSDGGVSKAPLMLSGRTLYGTASAGGINGCGTIFAVNTDGTGFTNLSSLGGVDTGLWTGVVLFGNTLYGITSGVLDLGDGYYGGSGSSVIFALNTDGTGFTNVSSGYSNSRANLTLADNTLYGTTLIGGNGGFGTIFAVSTNGTGFTNLYSFNPPDSGFNAVGGLVFGSNALYGTTEGGGNYDYGTIYAINADGSGFTNIFSFNGTNGISPAASLVLSGNRLYGTTLYDLTRNCGTIFAVNTDGSGFTNLYNFGGYDGANPQANLILCGNTLYGTTSSGGGGGYGTVFSIHTDGTCFTTLYSFSGGNDGATPYDGLLLSGNTLYGTTSAGGSNGNGTVFALSLGAIPLNVQPDGSGIILTWGNPAFSLESASAVNGPYTTVSGATSPYIPAISCSQQFFRLQAP